MLGSKSKFTIESKSYIYMREDLRSWGPALGQGAAEDKEGTQA